MGNGLLSNTVTTNVVSPAIRNSNRDESTAALVIKRDETNNLCDIAYLDNGRSAKAINCMVDLRNGANGWFPKKGEAVLFQPDGTGSGTVLSKYTEDYSEIKGKMQFRQDRLNNGDTGLCGGQVTGMD